MRAIYRKIKAAVIPEQQTLLSNSERHNGTEITVDLPMACTVTNIRSACKKKSTFPRQKETCFLNISRSEGHDLVGGLFTGLDGDDVHYRALALVGRVIFQSHTGFDFHPVPVLVLIQIHALGHQT